MLWCYQPSPHPQRLGKGGKLGKCFEVSEIRVRRDCLTENLFLTFSAACFGFLSAIEINFHLMLSCLDLVFPPVMSQLFTFCCLFCPSIPSDGSYVSLCLVTLAPTPLFRDWNDAHLGKEWSPNCVSIRCHLIVWRRNLNRWDTIN